MNTESEDENKFFQPTVLVLDPAIPGTYVCHHTFEFGKTNQNVTRTITCKSKSSVITIGNFF